MSTQRRMLVTAGATQVPIDKVRAITNIFKGRTGTSIANYFYCIGYKVTLITSNPDLAYDLSFLPTRADRQWDSRRILVYRTFDELLKLMEKEIRGGDYDVVIHSAAVSDYRVDGICAMDEEGALVELDKSGKVGSDHKELYLRLEPTQKIIDLIREPWDFDGYLVKFKLQVGISDGELLEIAEKSRVHSRADMIVANCLEWSDKSAFVITDEKTTRCSRLDLPVEILHGIERARI